MMFLVLLMLLGAVLETAGVSMVLPVMNVVMDEHAVEKHAYLRVICDILHIEYENTRGLIIVTMTALIRNFSRKKLFSCFFSRKPSSNLFTPISSPRPEE